MSAAELSGKVVVVTGAAQGIGAAYTRRFAASGCTVVAADINDDRGEALVEEVKSSGFKALFRHLDVADEASCRTFAEALSNDFDHIDGLVNNAAVFSSIEMKPFWEISTEEWDKLMSVNLRGPWMLTKILLPLLRASASASVVNISSDAAWMGRPGYLHYVSSKAAMAGMSNSMARELGELGIRVNAVSPGPVYTEIERATVTAAQKDAMLGLQALKRHAEPDDMVGVVAFLLSDSARWITGQNISVNGGLLHR